MNWVGLFWETLAITVLVAVVITLRRDGACQGGVLGRLWGHKFGYRDGDFDWNPIDNCRRCGKHVDAKQSVAELEARVRHLEKWGGIE